MSLLAEIGNVTFFEEPLPQEPTGVYQHSDGRPLLGRKLKGKSKRELRDLGLLVEDDSTGAAGSRDVKGARNG